jgi:hypothetical protein
MLAASSLLRSDGVGHSDVCLAPPLRERRHNVQFSALAALDVKMITRTVAADGVDAIRVLISAAIVMNAASTLVASACQWQTASHAEPLHQQCALVQANDTSRNITVLRR